MNIIWHGQACFKLSTQKEKNGSVNILIDPFEKETGLRPPKLEADVLLLTDPKKKAVAGPALLVTGPGEYDFKGIYIQGIEGQSKNEDGAAKSTIYIIEAEDMKLCHLGLLGQKELTPEQLEKIGDVDILMVPMGGGMALEAGEALKIMSQVEPKITIPMYYKIPGLKLKLEELGRFLKALGIKSLEAQPKLSLKKKDLSEEEAKVIVLQP